MKFPELSRRDITSVKSLESNDEPSRRQNDRPLIAQRHEQLLGHARLQLRDHSDPAAPSMVSSMNTRVRLGPRPRWLPRILCRAGMAASDYPHLGPGADGLGAAGCQ